MSGPNAAAGPTPFLAFEPEFKQYKRASRQRLAMVAQLRAPVLGDDDAKRAPVSLSCVLDKSGSMAGSKLQLVKRTCEFMTTQLGNTDKLGVVQYDSTVQELLPLSKTCDQFKDAANDAIKRMRDGSCTNLSGGLFKGVQQQLANRYLDWFGAVPDDARRTAPAPPAGASDSHTESDDSGVLSQEAIDQLLAGAAAPDATECVQCADEEAVSEDEDEGEELQQTVQVQQQQINININAPPPMPPAPQPAPQPRGFFGRVFGGQRAAPRPVRPQKRMPVVGSAPRLPASLKALPRPPEQPVEDDAVRSVFLFTDGLANEGICDPARLEETLRRMLDATPRVRVYTFGFGADHDPRMLKALADVGQGVYYYIEDEEKIPQAFANALGGLLSVAVQNLELTFTPAKDVGVAAVHTGFQTVPAADRGTTIQIGDMFSEESKDIVIELDLPEMRGAAADVVVGTLRATYLDVSTGSLVDRTVPCTVDRPDEVNADAVRNPAVAAHFTRVRAARAMEEATVVADRGDITAARAMLQDALAKMEVEEAEEAAAEEACPPPPGAPPSKTRMMRRRAQKDMQSALGGLVDHATYASKGGKVMRSAAAQQMQQRAYMLDDDDLREECATDCDEEGEGFGAPGGGGAGAPCSMPAPRMVTGAQVAMRKKAKAFFSK
ncbi:unnamed protein product [Pedinophyceae sp. YPF-701]|nr:unnamed protein product [Pedinophyceae sp. YPF-701]